MPAVNNAPAATPESAMHVTVPQVRALKDMPLADSAHYACKHQDGVYTRLEGMIRQRKGPAGTCQGT
jgi:hypothetical protein